MKRPFVLGHAVYDLDELQFVYTKDENSTHSHKLEILRFIIFGFKNNSNILKRSYSSESKRDSDFKLLTLALERAI